MAKWMGQREYARHRKCSLRAVQIAIESGRIKYEMVESLGEKKIDQEQADRDWAINTDSLKKPPQYEASQPPVVTLPPAPDPDPESPAEPNKTEPTELTQARIRQMNLRVEREQMELDAARGKYVDVNDARRAAFTAFRSLRDNVLNVVARISGQLNLSHDHQTVLTSELEQALGSFRVEHALTEVDEEQEEEAPA